MNCCILPNLDLSHWSPAMLDITFFPKSLGNDHENVCVIVEAMRRRSSAPLRI